MQYPSCPVNTHGMRDYYKKAIADSASRIVNVDKRLAAAELARRPALAENPRWRATRATKPKEILALIGKGAFRIVPHSMHRNNLAERDRWVGHILGIPGWEGD